MAAVLYAPVVIADPSDPGAVKDERQAEQDDRAARKLYGSKQSPGGPGASSHAHNSDLASRSVSTAHAALKATKTQAVTSNRRTARDLPGQSRFFALPGLS
jgi:hypothetical protein